MIVPRNKLILWAGIVLLPATLLAAAQPAFAPAMIGIGAAFVAFAALDAVLAVGSLNAISVELPDLVRLSRDRKADILVTVKNQAEQATPIRIGLDFPLEFEPEARELPIVAPADMPSSAFRWYCTPRRRGTYRFTRCYIERSSKLGLWDYRKTCTSPMEVRVYPNLLKESKRLSMLFLTRGNVGSHAQRQVGRGREFEQLRDYLPGDSFEDIHWKASAKRGRPVTKMYQVERTQEVYVVIDASRLSSRRANPDDPKNNEIQLERFLNAALLIGLAAEKHGDNFGIIVFDDRVQNFVRARNGRAHYGACRDAIFSTEPKLVSPDYEELFRFIRLRLTRRALVIMLTNLDDPILAESFENSVQLVNRQHLMLVGMITPGNCKAIFNNGAANSIEDIYQHLGNHHVWRRLQELDKVLKRRGIAFHLVESEVLCAQLVTQYVNVKQRQIL